MSGLIKKMLSPTIRLLAYLKIPPNTVTVTGFAISIVAAWLYGRGVFWLAGIIMVVSGLLDMIDGELSRLVRSSTRFGAFLDSTLDRVTECLAFIGLGVYYSSINYYYVILVIVTLCGSMMVSYTRARAEGLGIQARVGFFERGVRLTFIFVGSLIGARAMIYILLILALGTISTVIHRMVFVYRSSK